MWIHLPHVGMLRAKSRLQWFDDTFPQDAAHNRAIKQVFIQPSIQLTNFQRTSLPPLVHPHGLWPGNPCEVRTTFRSLFSHSTFKPVGLTAKPKTVQTIPLTPASYRHWIMTQLSFIDSFMLCAWIMFQTFSAPENLHTAHIGSRLVRLDSLTQFTAETLLLPIM